MGPTLKFVSAVEAASLAIQACRSLHDPECVQAIARLRADTPASSDVRHKAKHSKQLACAVAKALADLSDPTRHPIDDAWARMAGTVLTAVGNNPAMSPDDIIHAGAQA